MWVSGCFRLKPQKDKTRRTLRAAAGGRSRRGSRGAGRGRARRSGPLRRLRALPAPRLRDGPARAQGLPRSRPARGAPARGTRGAGRRRTGEGPQRPLAARPAPSPRVPIPTGSGARGRCPQERAPPCHQGLKVAQPPARRRLPHTMAFNYFFFLFKTL